MEEEADLLDLAHLTEVEQTMILNVLLRDAELRQWEEGRISKLGQVESDPVRLRSLSGTWFTEERAKRHQSRGADIIHASIRRKKRGKAVSYCKNNLTDCGKCLCLLQMSGSLMSLYSVGDFGGVTVTGRIQLSLHYDPKKEELHVCVCCCQDLAPARNNCSDPYVKVYLLPDNTSRSKKKTAVKRKTLNPVYDETLKYKVRKSELQARVLSVSVWHMERVRRNLFLGEVEVGLDQWDWGRSQPTWYSLQPRVQMNPDAIISRGTILFSMKFIPPGSEGGGFPLTGELHIWLREVIGLLPPKRGIPNTHVKSVVLPDESGVSGQQTRVVRGSVSPVFNHTMVYDGLQSSDLLQACAEITVWNSSNCLGGVRLSTGSGVSYGQKVCWMDSTEEEISVWNTIIGNPNSWVDAALPVRTSLQLCSE
uniref:Synaptotagmin-like protein 1 n=1 Tax=Astyanax mexicanus TaxID=7994 RepID=A0A8B9KHP7_ASTMX